MIENMTTELTMLGTGNATVTKCYNTCFTIKSGQIVVIGCSTSEVVGHQVGSWSTPEVATVYWDSWRKRESR